MIYKDKAKQEFTMHQKSFNEKILQEFKFPQKKNIINFPNFKTLLAVTVFKTKECGEAYIIYNQNSCVIQMQHNSP